MANSSRWRSPFEKWVKSGGMTVAEVSRTLHRPYDTVYSWYTGRCMAPVEFKIGLELISNGAVKVADWGPL